MKNAFNFQSINPWRTTAKALAIAFPALFVNTANYGWQGMFVLSALTAGVMTVSRQRLDADLTRSHQFRNLNQKIANLSQHIESMSLKLEELGHAAPPGSKSKIGALSEEYSELSRRLGDLDSYHKMADYVAAPPDSRESHISQDLSPHFELPPIKIYYRDDPRKPFETDLRVIKITKAAAEKVTDGEMRFIIAHELDHIRHEHDLHLLTPVKAFNTLATVTGFAAAYLAFGQIDPAPLPTTTASLTGAAISYAFMTMTNAHIWRNVERRADANALRATGDLDSAKSALTKIYDILAKNNPKEMAIHNALKPFQKHPPLQTRLANLDRTWETMQREAQQKIAAPVPGAP